MYSPPLSLLNFTMAILMTCNLFAFTFLKHSETSPFFFMQKTNMNLLKSQWTTQSILHFLVTKCSWDHKHSNERTLLLSLVKMFCHFLGKEVVDFSCTHNLHTTFFLINLSLSFMSFTMLSHEIFKIVFGWKWQKCSCHNLRLLPPKDAPNNVVFYIATFANLHEIHL